MKKQQLFLTVSSEIIYKQQVDQFCFMLSTHWRLFQARKVGIVYPVFTHYFTESTFEMHVSFQPLTLRQHKPHTVNWYNSCIF